MTKILILINVQWPLKVSNIVTNILPLVDK